MRYIYHNPNWPDFEWDSDRLLAPLSMARNLQGRIVGKMDALGFDLKNRANLEILTLDVLKSTEIEGELLNPEQVRSSIARRLGLEVLGLLYFDRNVDGMVDMMLDATKNFDTPLEKERLFGWHNALFPGGYSGMYKVLTGNWRDDSTGPIQIVSGALGREKVHFQAPPASKVGEEMDVFMKWLNGQPTTDLVLKAAIAHLWFVTIHPFEDGNGRIARALTDRVLAQSDGQPLRFYSMSSQIRNQRKGYYDILDKTQSQDDLDITGWLKWFLNCLLNALQASESILSMVIFKHNFWQANAHNMVNDRQRKMVDMLIDGFEGRLNTSKWAKICKCSADTALRDIQDLLDKGILVRLGAGGRSTGYGLR